ncbi:MAG: T9SS type A sorting domain-containing protein [Saprospiraceae bacterium]|nr:T9SS type A sorting domain-containing protein [Saprospiraceae bacterium]
MHLASSSSSWVGQPFSSGVTTLELENFKFFPNPVAQNATIHFDTKKSSATRLSVSNAMGQMVLKQHLGILPAGRQNLELDMAHLANGIYFLHVQTAEGLKTIRFVKTSR